MSNMHKELQEITIKVDDHFPPRPHCSTGPFVTWLDGTKLYAIHGIPMPGWPIEDRDSITLDKINSETNAEIRRILIDFYGEERYFKESDPEILDEDTDQFNQKRTLFKMIAPVEDIVKVRVVNSSPELDKTYHTFYLPVDPELRPLFPNIVGKYLDEAIVKAKNMTREERIRERYLGNPQSMTCHNAVASTFGKRGEEYGLPGQTRQGDVFIEFKDGSNQRKFRES